MQELSGSLFTILARVFKRNSVHPVLVGGYAINTYKIQRMTFDVDFIMTAEDCERMEKDIIDLGYSVFNRRDAFVQYKDNKSGLRDIDFLLTDSATINKLITTGHTVSIAGEEFMVPSAMHLISMKLHAVSQNPQREMKDLADIVALMRHNQIDPATEEVTQLFQKFNAVQYLQRVRSLVGAVHG